MMKRQTLISTVSNDRFIPPGSEKAYSSTGFQQVTDCNGGDSKGMASQVEYWYKVILKRQPARKAYGLDNIQSGFRD